MKNISKIMIVVAIGMSVHMVRGENRIVGINNRLPLRFKVFWNTMDSKNALTSMSFTYFPDSSCTRTSKLSCLPQRVRIEKGKKQYSILIQKVPKGECQQGETVEAVLEGEKARLTMCATGLSGILVVLEPPARYGGVAGEVPFVFGLYPATML